MSAFPSGRTRIGTTDEAGVWTPHSDWVPNKRMATGGFIEAMSVGFKNPAYGIAAAYIEFKNVGDPSDRVASPPTPAFNDTIAYYEGLFSAGADYLRVPLLPSPNIGIIPGNEADFVAGQGNLVTYLIQSSGAVAGGFGTPFNNASNSLVYGVALVATPVLNDRTQDILFARAYYAAANQLIVPVNGQISIPYQVPFGPSS